MRACCGSDVKQIKPYLLDLSVMESLHLCIKKAGAPTLLCTVASSAHRGKCTEASPECSHAGATEVDQRALISILIVFNDLL